MPVTYIANHADAAEDRLLECYKSKPKVVALVRAFTQRAQVIEDAIRDLQAGTQLNNKQAIGAQLDAIGATVGIPRNGQTDAVYYILILGSIAKNYSNGDTDTLVQVAKDIWQASAIYISTPNSPGHVRHEAYGAFNLAIADAQTDPDLLKLLIKILTDSISAGVRMTFIASFTNQGAFACEGPQPWVRGCSDVHGGGGGACAGLLYAAPTT